MRLWSNTLQAELEAKSGALAAAQDRIRDLEADLLECRAELAASRKDTTDSVMHVADWLSQSMFGRKIYAETPILPETKQEPALIGRKVQARQLVNELERQFFDQFEPTTQ